MFATESFSNVYGRHLQTWAYICILGLGQTPGLSDVYDPIFGAGQIYCSETRAILNRCRQILNRHRIPTVPA